MRLKDIRRGCLSLCHVQAAGLVVLLAAVSTLGGCESASTDVMDWPGFIASFAGDPEVRSDYPFGVAKGAVSPQVAASMNSGVVRFVSWCAAHGGRGDHTQRLQLSSVAASRFHTALSAKFNADRADGNRWAPSDVVACVDEGGARLVAAMLSIQGYEHEAFERDGKRFDKLIRVFFDRQQAEDFAASQERREAERSARVAAASANRQAARDDITKRLRTQPRVGDRTSLGVVIELRPPLALVQYDRRYQEVSGRPASEWLRIDGLSAPSE